ncbi:MAG: hypothetical protein GY754_19790 [bacterium]|nr:hypothetical protein [bacterium]
MSTSFIPGTRSGLRGTVSFGDGTRTGVRGTVFFGDGTRSGLRGTGSFGDGTRSGLRGTLPADRTNFVVEQPILSRIGNTLGEFYD